MTLHEAEESHQVANKLMVLNPQEERGHDLLSARLGA